MQPFVIYTDASADLNPAFLRAEDIRVLPMTCLSREEEPRTLTGYESDEELRDFYRMMWEGAMFSTSQITPGEYEEAFAPVLEAGQDIVYLALSSGLTSTVESANMAAENLNRKYAPARVHVVDTLSATGGIDLLAEKAVTIRGWGLNAAEAATALRELAKKVCHVFVVSDLMHLSRGGRISSATAVVGTVLHVLPILIIDAEGKLQVIDRKRGEKSAVRELRLLLESTWDKQDRNMYSVHGDCLAEAEMVEREIRSAVKDARIEKRIISPVIGAHTGPGLFSIVYFGDRNKLK